MAKKKRDVVEVIIPDSHGAHIDPAVAAAVVLDIKALDPDRVVFLGDHLDCGGVFSVHQRGYTNEMTESYADDVEATNKLLDQVQKAAPRASGYYLEGNHERHVERWASREFHNRRDAEMVLDRMGPAAVLNLKARGIRYFLSRETHMGLAIPGTILLDKCYFTHGTNASRHAAAAHLADFGDNIIFGHVHRACSEISRNATKHAYLAACPGTLAKLQPSYMHTRPTRWSHGYGLRFIAPTKTFMYLHVPIYKGRSLLSSVISRAGL